jgi:hypothetical protein
MGLASTNVPTRSVVVAQAATASDGNGESSCRPSGISRVAKPSSSTRLAVAAHRSPPPSGVATTPKRNL